ncbi:MAG: hypothetical protein MJK10_00685 [Pseudomonadales bacterium]|nr:hypothetical protein [Pseudomonadales bacterium]NRA14394.1 hypothetical protein [Oceanospirillaceae bacterium]
MSGNKQVIGNIYNTEKMFLCIGDNLVTKHFKKSSNYLKRFHQERKSLLRLQQLAHVPHLMAVVDRETTLHLSRLPGCSASSLTVQNLIDLEKIVKQMLAAGVARHSMPIRDVLVDDCGEISLVDFERSTLRSFNWSPVWLIATKVTKYHYLKLVEQYQPQMLTEKQRQQLQKALVIRQYFLVFRKLRDYVRRR